MGNSLRRKATLSWADEEEEWEWADAGHQPVLPRKPQVKLLGKKGGEALHAGATEVKIKIAKKQLEELLRKVDAQGLPLQQVLVDLMSGASAGDVDALHQRARHWQPVLQSIPEAGES